MSERTETATAEHEQEQEHQQAQNDRPDGITESEYREIEQAVDAIMISREKRDEPSVGEGARSGIGSVILVSLGIALALALAIFAYTQFVPREAPDVNVVTGAVTTTESQILRRMRDANTRTLTEREVRIVEIQDELLNLQSTRSRSGETDEIAAQERVLLLELDRLGATPAERLSLLTEAGERRAFFSSQLNSIYEQMQLRIQEGDFPAAEQLIFDAAQLVESPIVQEDPSLQALASTARAANQILVGGIPRIGADRASEETARELEEVTEQNEALRSAVSQAEARAASLQRSLSRTAARLEQANAELASAQANEPEAAEARAARREVAELEDELAAARDEYEVAGEQLTAARNRLAAAAPSTSPNTDDIVSLLNTRVLLRAVVDSPAVREQYPGLYDQMEEYFVAFENDRIAQGSEATLEWAAEAIRSVGSAIGLDLSGESVETHTQYLSLLAELVAGALAVGTP